MPINLPTEWWKTFVERYEELREELVPVDRDHDEVPRYEWDAEVWTDFAQGVRELFNELLER